MKKACIFLFIFKISFHPLKCSTTQTESSHENGTTKIEKVTVKVP